MNDEIKNDDLKKRWVKTHDLVFKKSNEKLFGEPSFPSKYLSAEHFKKMHLHKKFFM